MDFPDDNLSKCYSIKTYNQKSLYTSTFKTPNIKRPKSVIRFTSRDSDPKNNPDKQPILGIGFENYVNLSTTNRNAKILHKRSRTHIDTIANSPSKVNDEFSLRSLRKDRYIIKFPQSKLDYKNDIKIRKSLLDVRIKSTRILIEASSFLSQDSKFLKFT